MRSKVIAVVLALGVALAVFAAEPAPSKSSASSAKKKAATKKAATSKTAGKTKGKSKSGSASKQKSKQTVVRRVAQNQPTADRYKEVQQALAEKGYFNGPVDGTWGAESVDSLKRFQRDQNIGDDGKLGSLSLIALGLGPKRDLSTNACTTAPCGHGAATESRP